MKVDWEGKLLVYFEAAVDLLFEGVLLALWILVTYGLAQLIRITVGQSLKS